MKIVVLDSHAVDFDGLHWAGFSDLGVCETFPRTVGSGELFGRAKFAEVLIVNKVKITESVLQELPLLRYVGITATGSDNVDIDACRKRNIAVTNVAGYSTSSVAQLVLAFILGWENRVSEYTSHVQNGEWTRALDFCLPLFSQRDLSGLRLGILGYGTIGKAVARRAEAFGMHILVAELPGRSYDEERKPLNEVLAESDYVSLHCPLTKQTEGLVDSKFLSSMKRSAVLINTARGKLVHELELAAALHSRTIAGACLDVLSTEPPASDNPLLTAPNTFLTPHIGWASRNAREKLLQEVYLNLQSFLEGRRRNRLD